MRRPRAAPASPPARALPASARPIRLVDLAPEFVQAFLDRVLRRALRRFRPRVGFRPSVVDLLTELVQALLDGVVLGLGRTHRSVFRSKTCDRLPRSTPVSPRWLRSGRPEREQPSERRPLRTVTRPVRKCGDGSGLRRTAMRDAETAGRHGARRPGRARWKDESDHGCHQCRPAAVPAFPRGRGRGPDRPSGRPVLGAEGRCRLVGAEGRVPRRARIHSTRPTGSSKRKSVSSPGGRGRLPRGTAPARRQAGQRLGPARGIST